MENIIVAPRAATPVAQEALRSIGFRAMGSGMLALLESTAPPAAGTLAEVPRWFEGWEQQLSRFRASSELSLLNSRAGQPVRVSVELWAVLEHALWQARQTGGLVTPLVLDALESAGYDRSFEPLTGLYSLIETLPAARPVPSWREVRRDAARRTVLLPPGVRLDFGGSAKGWAADQAAKRLGRLGAALVDAGGDIAVSGPPYCDSGWSVGVADPTAPEQHLEILRVCSGGVATSGRDYRRWQRGGVEMHHIIDPRSGRPAETDVLSATTVGPSTVAAEAAAKAALILGSKDGLAWVERQPDLAAMVVLDNGRVIRSRNFDQHVWQ